MPRVDPDDVSSYNHRFVTIPRNGLRYHLVDQPPTNFVGNIKDAPTLLLLHGFPDLWYGWRYQIHDFASRGWRVIVPSQVGYGETSKPSELKHYSFKSICYDMNTLLDQIGVPGQVVVVGHDWGGMIAWRMCNYFPHRVKAIASVCTPYQKPAEPGMPSVPDEILIRKFLPNFGYQIFFKSPEAIPLMDEVADIFLQPCFSADFRRRKVIPEDAKMSTWCLEGNLEKSIRRQIGERREGKLPIPPREKGFAYYVDTFAKNGMEGPLSWYKTRSINFAEEQAANLPPFTSHIPALQIPAAMDAALPPSMCLAKPVLACFPGGNLEVKVLDAPADHWCLQDEQTRGKVTAMLGDWIENVVQGKWRPSGTVVAKL